jgi:beta-lactamase regulating signal transducer with metallopeptidase domain
MTSLLIVGLSNAVIAAALTVVAFAVTRVTKNPHLAHALWLVVLLKLVTPPLVDVPLPRGLFATAAEDPTPTPTPTPVASDPSLRTPSDWITPDPNPALPAPSPAASSPLQTQRPPVHAQRPASAPTTAAATPSSPWPIYLGISWLVGSLICGAVAFVRTIRFHRQLKQMRLASDDIQQIGASAARQLGLKRRPQLSIADGHLSPMVWPIGSPPTVVLPQGLVDELDRDELRAIIAHEFAHIARRDCWVRWLEVLCTVLYWWNPCLWFARRKLRAAEELCTDALAVASQPGSARVFGESLLKADDFLAGTPFTAPLLVSQMRGGGQLLHRIESIVAGGVPPRLSLTTKCAVIVVAICVLPLSAQERQPGQPTTPPAQSVASDSVDPATLTLADVVTGLKAREDAITTLTAHCRVESRHNFTKPGNGPLPDNVIQDDAVAMTRDGNVDWKVSRDGRGRMEATHKTASVRDDGSTKPRIEECISTFDGAAGKMLSITRSPSGVVTQRRQSSWDSFMKTDTSPYDFTTQHLGKPISALLSVEGCRVIGPETWEDRPVVVVEAPPVTVRENYIYQQRFWVDPNRGYAVVRRQSNVQCGEGKPWGLHYQIDAKNHAEVAPGTWLPAAVEILNYHVNESGQDFLSSREQIAASDWNVNDNIDPSRFSLPPESLSSIGQPIIAPATSPPDGTKQSYRPSPENSAKAGFRTMLIKTIDDQGRPVPNVGIYVNASPLDTGRPGNATYTTDDRGEAFVQLPAPHRLVRMWTQKAGYVPLFTQWWPEHQPDGHLIPNEYTLTLPTGTEIGGVIKNDEGEPIEGAIVEVALGNMLDEMNRRPVPSMWLAENSRPGENPCITDAEGRWSLDNVPPGGEVFVRVKITHPHYVSDTQWGALQEEQAVRMPGLRDKSATLVMHRGIALMGKVTDPEGKPVPNAVVVWGENPYMQQGSQEVTTNAAGEYRLQPLRPRATTVTVVAEGFSPASRSVTIRKSNAAQDFQLENGNLLRIRFVDASGKPVPNVGVSIRGWRGAESLYNHRHPNVLNTNIPVRSNEQGIFEWNWAPADDVDYAFYASGMIGTEQSLKADGSEHTMILSK